MKEVHQRSYICASVVYELLALPKVVSHYHCSQCRGSVYGNSSECWIECAAMRVAAIATEQAGGLQARFTIAARLIKTAAGTRTMALRVAYPPSQASATDTRTR